MLQKNGIEPATTSNDDDDDWIEQDGMPSLKNLGIFVAFTAAVVTGSCSLRDHFQHQQRMTEIGAQAKLPAQLEIEVQVQGENQEWICLRGPAPEPGVIAFDDCKFR